MWTCKNQKLSLVQTRFPSVKASEDFQTQELPNKALHLRPPFTGLSCTNILSLNSLNIAVYKYFSLLCWHDSWHRMTCSRQLNRSMAVSDVKLSTYILRLLSNVADSGHVEFKPFWNLYFWHQASYLCRTWKTTSTYYLHMKGRMPHKAETLLSDTGSFQSSQQASHFNLISTFYLPP